MNYLKRIVNERNISWSELSRSTKIDRATISKIASNKVKGMRIDTAYRLARSLDIPIETLINNMLDTTKIDKEILEPKGKPKLTKKEKEIKQKDYNHQYYLSVTKKKEGY